MAPSTTVFFLLDLKFEVFKFENGENTRLRLMGKRKIAILIIDSILGQVRCESACYNKSEMGLYNEFG
jgi:hypothetical protein